MTEKLFYDNARHLLFEYEYQLELLEGLIENDIPVHLGTYLYLNNQVMMIKKLIETYENKMKVEEKERWMD